MVGVGVFSINIYDGEIELLDINRYQLPQYIYTKCFHSSYRILLIFQTNTFPYLSYKTISSEEVHMCKEF